ncbi:hypothetical protein JR590_002223, partial [Listeria monocytogenes]|nr:hypothetical protein [Listeria monocytogenes]
MWKKGKQWLCGAALFFTVVSSPGMLVLADEVNAGDATEVTAGEEAPPLPEESTENEVEGATEEDGTSSSEVANPNQQEENTPNTTENNEAKVDGGKKERPKQGRLITTPTAIKDIFPDANLAEAIRAKLGKTSVNDTVTQSDLDSINNFNASNKNIADISGLNHLVRLTNLVLSGNQISDISPLAEIPKLSKLNLHDNRISDVSLISSKFVYLQDLKLSNNQISDMSPIGNAQSTGILVLDLRYNQISDISSLPEGNSKFTDVSLDYNQISDVSSVQDLILNPNNDNNPSYAKGCVISVTNQKITLPTQKKSNLISTPNIVKGFTTILSPNNISNEGWDESGEVKWTGLPNVSQEVTYSWLQNYEAGAPWSLYFSGTVTLGVEPLEAKILVDTDGNSQTTSDQTLFAEESDANWNSLEDMYTYVKEQLNGTDYGLLSVEQDSDDNYVVLVSKVGSLKKEDADGTAVGTDIPFTPTYTITGTGDDAELVVSYDEVVIDPPTGYVYIYEKGTAQEVRYTEETSFAVPLTDTNSNGIPQWKEDYTVKQYKRAGALKPTTPGGSQVPGGTISIP